MRYLASILLFLGPLLSAKGQENKDQPQAILHEIRSLPDGGFLLAVRIQASAARPLKLLYPQPPKPSYRLEDGSLYTPPLEIDPFTLGQSRLMDRRTEKVFPALATLPDNPYVGPLSITVELLPGHWVQMGVAFPAIPPSLQNGNPLPYEFRFSIPELRIHTEFSVDPKTLAILDQKPVVQE